MLIIIKADAATHRRLPGCVHSLDFTDFLIQINLKLHKSLHMILIYLHCITPETICQPNSLICPFFPLTRFYKKNFRFFLLFFEKYHHRSFSTNARIFKKIKIYFSFIFVKAFNSLRACVIIL